MINQRRLAVFVAAVAIFFCSSCEIYSLYPWFSEDVQVFEEKLLGRWGSAAGTPGNYFEITRGPENTYDILHWESGEVDEEFRGAMHARLGKIDGVYYLDVMAKRTAEEQDEPAWLYAVHMLVRLDLENDRLRLGMLDLEKLENMGMSGLRAVEVGNKSDYDYTDGILIVSETYRLQQFLQVHGQGGDVWMMCDQEEEDNCWLPRL